MDAPRSRRQFLAGLSAAGTAAFVAGLPGSLHAEPPPETTSVRLPKFSTAVCLAPQYVAEELLRAEGFTDIRYVEGGSGSDSADWLAHGEIDFDPNFPASHIKSLDAGTAITILCGLHVGCYELRGNEGIRSIADLKGKTVGVDFFGSGPDAFLNIMAVHVGLDPARDINWVTSAEAHPMELFAQGKIDAFIAFAPEVQEVRARGLGHAIVNTAVDRPWSQYFCCLVAGRRDYVQNYPVATKRVLRAILKAADLCAADPETAARLLVDGGYAERYDYAAEAMREIRYDRWREYDPADTIRFFALRMHEAGMIKTDPKTLIAAGTDWHFLEELKQELKG